MSDTFDLVRIIAKDSKGMHPLDREILRNAADEMEQHLKLLVSTQDHLIQANQHRIALTEKLLGFTAQKMPVFNIDDGSITVLYVGAPECP